MPLTIGPASLPAAALNNFYAAQLLGSGGTAPYSFSVVSGSIPAGLVLLSSGMISGTPTLQVTATFSVEVKDAANNTAQFPYTLVVGNTTANCTYSVNPSSTSIRLSGGTAGFTVSTQVGCSFGFLIDDSWIHLTSPANQVGGGNAALSVDANTGPGGRASLVGVTAAGRVVGTYAISQFGTDSTTAGLTFVPLPPCRVIDTRTGFGFSGPFGPPSLKAGETRTVNVPLSTCAVPAIANAYVINVTLLPKSSGSANGVTIYPADEEKPRYTTASAADGNVVANAAIVRAGAANGGINVWLSAGIRQARHFKPLS